MAACSSWKYTGITPAVFRGLQAAGQKQGVTIPSQPRGKFTIEMAGMKIGFQYEWETQSGRLTLVCTSKPSVLSCTMIKGFADRIVTQGGGKVS
jgi:trimethylamine:corrinoid methyltransferase-like protein